MNRNEQIEDNCYYHVYNRGNNRERIFGDASDYVAFIEKMKTLAVRYSVSVPVYALMPNHYHLIAVQRSGKSMSKGHLHLSASREEGDLHLNRSNLSRMMGVLATSAAKRYNLKYGHIGHLFQGPFRYKPIDEDALMDVACYIHLNPVRAKLATKPEDWMYSNYCTFVAGMETGDFLRQRNDPSKHNVNFCYDYPAFVAAVLQNERVETEFWKRVEGNLLP